MAYVYVPGCVGSAIVQTQHAFRSPTCDHNASVFGQGPVALMVINSGNANTATGALGRDHVAQTVAAASRHFGVPVEAIGVASTGIIGVPLPVQKIVSGIATFSGTEKQGGDCLKAILTTDLVPKQASRTVMVGGQRVHMAGITKGSGMIAPNMATTLGFIVTDLALTSDECHRLLQPAIDASYNCLSVDTDSSTNDLVTLQSSGAVSVPLSDADWGVVQEALTALCVDLAKQIAKDGEGATHSIDVIVRGASTALEARQLAKQVVNSPLVKTAIAGNDPNWGRLVMAIGKGNHPGLKPDHLSIVINGHVIMANGQPVNGDRDAVRNAMAVPDVVIEIGVGDGAYESVAYGCDLTHGYIDINMAYN